MKHDHAAEFDYVAKGTGASVKGKFVIRKGEVVKIGRDPDEKKNNICLPYQPVSRCHLEFFCVGLDDVDDHHPMVYARDRRSMNGTFINGRLIGKAPTLSPAVLLTHDDEIVIKDSVTIRFTQFILPSPRFELGLLRRAELTPLNDRYRVTDRTIGHGAVGTIHVAVDVISETQLACKVCSLRAPSKNEGRVWQEAVILSQLDHPNILAFKAAFYSLTTMYILTELATGGDLFSLISFRSKPLREIDVRWMIRQLVTAIHYLHRKGVVHRDIKPENILCAISPRAVHRLVLSDFGSSAIANGSPMMSQVGTAHYRAPEAMLHDRPYDYAVDMWAVGFVTLQVMAGNTYDIGESLRDSPFRSAPTLSSQPEVDNFLDCKISEITAARAERGDVNDARRFSNDAEKFIRECLTLEPGNRITAADALKHSWLCQPRKDRNYFDELYRDNRRHWKPRNLIHNPIEELPDMAISSEYLNHQLHASSPKATNRKRSAIADALAHLSDERPSKRNQRYAVPAPTLAHNINQCLVVNAK